MDVSKKNEAAALQTSPELLSDRVEDADEISLLDILKFLQRQFKVIAGVTLGATLLGLGTGLAATPQAQRELLIHLALPPELALNSNIAASQPLMWSEIVTDGNLALTQDFPALVNNGFSSSVPTSASLSLATEENLEHLQLVLTGNDATILEAADPLALNTLQTVADDVVESYIEPEVARLDLLIQRTQAKIERLESRVISAANLPSGDAINFSSFLELQQQAQQQSLLAQQLSLLDDYELERENLSNQQQRNDSLLKIEVLMTTQIQESSSLLQRLVLSAIAGFMLSILIALIIDQVPQIRSALATPES